jgi:hypothetical protein
VSCRKEPYRSKAEAKVAVRHAGADLGGRRMGTYRCRDCSAWHIGHSQPRPTTCSRCRAPIVLALQPVTDKVVPYEPDTYAVHDCRRVAA